MCPGTALIVVIGALGTLMPLLSFSFVIIGRRSQTFINKQTQKPRPERTLSFLKDREGECWVAEITEGLSEEVAFEQNLERREVGNKCELHAAVGSLFHKLKIAIVYLTLQPKINITHKNVTHQVSILNEFLWKEGVGWGDGPENYLPPGHTLPTVGLRTVE